jgi:hypothetical protein
MWWKLTILFTANLFAYTLLYVTYAWAAKTMPSRIVWTAAVLAGTLLGSTVGERLFK